MALCEAAELDNLRAWLHYPSSMFQIHGGGRFGAEILLVGGVVLQYVSTRFSITALGRADGSKPGWHAVGQWMPILFTALAALVMGMPEMAISLVFGSSVACLSLVLGMTAYVSPIGPNAPHRRLWATVLPASIFLLLAGFHGTLTWFHAVMLLVMGAAFLAVWLERSDELASLPLPRESSHPMALLIPGLVLGAAGAAITAYGATRSSTRLLTPELLAATILSPLLLLPALGVGTMLAQQGHTDRVLSALCGTVLLNLCLLLPAVILIHYATTALQGRPAATSFPMICWRVDGVLLVVLSFALVPVAAGRWLPERLEATLLVIIYVGYFLAEILISARVFS